MKLQQIDLIRILENVDVKIAVDAILSSEPYQNDILKAQEDLVTVIENLLFDQVGDLADLAPQFSELFGQNIRSLVAYVSGNPLAAGTDYPDQSISLYSKLLDVIKAITAGDDTEDLREQLRAAEARADQEEQKRKQAEGSVRLVKLLIKLDRDYYCGKATQPGGGTDIQITICNHMRRVYDDIKDV